LAFSTGGVCTGTFPNNLTALWLKLLRKMEVGSVGYGDVRMVTRGGIEPPTRGFSEAALNYLTQLNQTRAVFVQFEGVSKWQ